MMLLPPCPIHEYITPIHSLQVPQNFQSCCIIRSLLLFSLIRACAYTCVVHLALRLGFVSHSRIVPLLRYMDTMKKNPPKDVTVQAEGLWYPYYSCFFIAL